MRIVINQRRFYMDNQDLERGNLDPRIGGFFRSIGSSVVRLLKDQRGFAGVAGEGGGEGSGEGGEGTGAKGTGQGEGMGAVDLSKVDFSKVDWSKANWKGEYAKDPAMEKHKDPLSLIKANKELEQFVGMEKIPLPTAPKEGATPAEIEKYNKQMAFVYNKLGRPESADKYDVKANFPATSPLDDKVMGAIKEVAFAEGMTNKQLNSVVAKYGEILTAADKVYNDQLTRDAETAVTTIKQKWGNAFDERVAVAQKFYNTLNPKMKELFGGDQLGNNPEMLEFFYDLGTKIGEDTIGGSGIPLTMTPDAAKQKIQELKIAQSKLNDGSPEYVMLQQQIDNAYKLAYPNLAVPEK